MKHPLFWENQDSGETFSNFVCAIGSLNCISVAAASTKSINFYLESLLIWPTITFGFWRAKKEIKHEQKRENRKTCNLILQHVSLILFMENNNKKIFSSWSGEYCSKGVNAVKTLVDTCFFSMFLVLLMVIFVLLCSDALYDTLRGTLVKSHWAVYNIKRNFKCLQFKKFWKQGQTHTEHLELQSLLFARSGWVI